MPISLPQFRKKWGKKFLKFMESEMGSDFKSLLDGYGPLSVVQSVERGDGQKAIAFQEYVGAYATLTGVINSAAVEDIEEDDDLPEFAPKNVLDRHTFSRPTKPKK